MEVIKIGEAIIELKTIASELKLLREAIEKALERLPK